MCAYCVYSRYFPLVVMMSSCYIIYRVAHDSHLRLVCLRGNIPGNIPVNSLSYSCELSFVMQQIRGRLQSRALSAPFCR